MKIEHLNKKIRSLSNNSIADFFRDMSLTKKLILVYVAILGLTVMIFASQLINSANKVTETAYLKDTQKLVKDTKTEIERKLEVCYRAMNSVINDYDIKYFLRTWRGSDANLFEFKMSLAKKINQIRYLNPDIYQLRIFIEDDQFPEVWPNLYNYSRISFYGDLKNEFGKGLKSFWLLNHIERRFEVSPNDKESVVSLFQEVKYPRDLHLGITEVTMLTKTFFSPVFTQSEKKNLLAFVVDENGNIILDTKSSFAHKYELDATNLRKLIDGINLKNSSGTKKIEIKRVPMNMVYDYMEDIGCTICYIVSNEEIISSLNRTRNLIIAESLVALIILCIIVYFITNMIFKKMKMVIASMRKVQDGKLDIRVDITGQDEMGELAYHFNKMLRKIQELISVVVKKQEATKNAEIRALFTQINSHFITNVLENIKMMAEIDAKYEIADSITSLGKLLRYGMKWTKEYVLLKEEIEYIKSYIELINLRYDNRVKFDIKIPPKLLEREVLKMSLQPIVENAVYHGIEPLGKEGILTIDGYIIDTYFVIDIIDNGMGMDSERVDAVKRSMESDVVLDVQERKGHGIGLKNVNDRIKLFYGDEYGLEIISEKGSYTKISMRLPYH